MAQTIKIKDVILNIVQLKKQRDSLKTDLAIVELQIEQQSKFLEDAIIEESIAEKQPTPTK